MPRPILPALSIFFVLGTTAGVRAQDEAHAVLERAIRAHGGAEKWARYRGGFSKSTGTMLLQSGITFTKDVLYQLPAQVKEVREIDNNGQKITTTTVFNGDRAWISYNGQTRELEDPKVFNELKETVRLVAITRLLPLREPGYRLTLLGEENVNGRPAVGIKVASAGCRDVSLYFDKGAGLLVKVERRLPDPGSGREVLEERVNSEYREIDGLLSPRRVTVYLDGKKFMDARAVEVKYLERVDEKEFARP